MGVNRWGMGRVEWPHRREEAMKREDAGLVGVVFIFVIIAVVLNSLGVLLDSAFAVASLGVIAVAMVLFVYWYVRFGR